ncbi:unnamed protein product, partial [Symbiodinium sp. KB8]
RHAAARSVWAQASDVAAGRAVHRGVPRPPAAHGGPTTPAPPQAVVGFAASRPRVGFWVPDAAYVARQEAEHEASMQGVEAWQTALAQAPAPPEAEPGTPSPVAWADAIAVMDGAEQHAAAAMESSAAAGEAPALDRASVPAGGYRAGWHVDDGQADERAAAPPHFLLPDGTRRALGGGDMGAVEAAPGDCGSVATEAEHRWRRHMKGKRPNAAREAPEQEDDAARELESMLAAFSTGGQR